MADRTGAQIVRDWEAKLRGRLKLLDGAERSVAYWSVRAGSKHGKQMLTAAVRRRELRMKQVAEARAVIARHRPKVAGMTAAGVNLVAVFEGFRSHAYRDVVGVWTIGYGETRGVTSRTAPVTQVQAFAMLRARLNRDYLAPALRYCTSVGYHPTANAADAFGSLAYNLGPGIFARGKTIGEAIASHDRTRIADAFLVYDKAGSPPRSLAGLTRRRQLERALFLK